MEKGKKNVRTKATAKVAAPVQKKKDNKQLKTTILGIAMMVAAIGLGVGTYAYYQTQITGTVSGSITPWSFKVNNNTATFTAQLGDLYPGVTGTIPLQVSTVDSGLGADVTISFSGLNNWPANLKLGKNADCSQTITPGTTQITDTLAANDSKTITIYYCWPYGTAGSDTSPSSDQVASVNITVVGKQVEPTP